MYSIGQYSEHNYSFMAPFISVTSVYIRAIIYENISQNVFMWLAKFFPRYLFPAGIVFERKVENVLMDNAEMYRPIFPHVSKRKPLFFQDSRLKILYSNIIYQGKRLQSCGRYNMNIKKHVSCINSTITTIII